MMTIKGKESTKKGSKEGRRKEEQRKRKERRKEDTFVRERVEQDKEGKHTEELRNIRSILDLA